MSTRSLKPVERPLALGQKVYNALRAELRSGAIQAGQALQEVQLAEQLGVSRTPVREAMARLASEGLLATEGRSFTVPALGRADVDDIYEVRFLIEPAALRSIAPLTVDAKRRAAVDAALADARAAHRDGDGDAFREANVRYRAAWLALVRNTRLVKMIELYADHLQHIRALTLDDAEVRRIVLRGLEEITSALARGDGDAVARAVHAHLQQAQRAFIQATGLAPAPTNGHDAPAANRPPHRSNAA